VLRSNEFTLRIELQNEIRRRLKLRSPEILQYSRFNLEGSPASKRKIKALIEEGKVSGWDDPRLVTLRALRRRGILPEAIHTLAIDVGLSTSSPVISWDTLFAINRKLLDPIANRYFFVPNPVRLEVKNAPNVEAKLKMHPSFPERGHRMIGTSGEFFIPGSDAEGMKVGDEIRLKDLYNIKIRKKGKDFIEAEYTGRTLGELPKIQWVTPEAKKVQVLVGGQLLKGEDYNEKSLRTDSGLVEKAIDGLKTGEICQFERYGFVKLEKMGKEPFFVFTHE
jgi:glutamyl-tRNA synthetase